MAIYQAQNWKIVKFADKLKDIVCLLIGYRREQLEDRNFKEKELGEEWGVWKVIRQDGTQFGRISSNKKDAEFTLSICSFSNCQVVFEKMTPRKMLQLIGTDLFRNQLHPNVWVNATMTDYKIKYFISDVDELGCEETVTTKEFPVYPNWIITDVRFPNEAKAIKDRGGILIKVNRPQAEIRDTNPEKALDNYTEWDYEIDNSLDYDYLINKVREILIKEKLI